MTGRGEWARTAAAGAAGLALGVTLLAGGALMLYAGEGVLSSAGFLIALVLISIGAGVWVGGPDGPGPGHRRMLGRWTLVVVALVVASFVAAAWLRVPAFQTSALGPPLALVLLLAEPAYALAALLAALEARRRGWLNEWWLAVRRPGEGGRASGVLVPAVVGAAAGSWLAASWLIPAYPPGVLYLGAAFLLAAAGSVEMGLAGDGKGGTMQDGVVVITGVGDRGQVGYLVAEAYRQRGARVVVTGRSSSVTELAAELGSDVVAVEADLTTEAGVARVVDAARSRWGRIDALINVAGGLTVTKPLLETTPEEWEREQDRNARTAFLMSRAALPLLRESKGSIVNFAAPAGQRAAAGLGAYSAAKAGVVALTRALALEEKGTGVRVNAVAPGMIDTAQNREWVDDPDSVTWVSREQIAAVVLFLTGPDGSGVNGEVIQVRGQGVA